ncbi:hypothetical protein Mlg_1755 [Alkalilimnicola ehrlichii MLHE-1]|uniref:Uncharacterized protein n=1 Tax=Alkalilimnicola ehrlichii (strain ATCC BAA-1101 / DSM 17681 / MLHE-1) TaxID=187272 RepID=Q0A7T6_ALKEH|nr:hypothetical protein Mlg_1755 [Alkalilimnicola ehrlichii MLHE-1]
MRFLHDVLRDARRPLRPGGTTLWRSPAGEAEPDESPAPPPEEDEDGAATVYRFQKAGEGRPPQVSERGKPAGRAPSGNTALPLPGARHRAEAGPPVAGEQYVERRTTVNGKTGSMNKPATAVRDRNGIAGERGSVDRSATVDDNARSVDVHSASTTLEKERLSVKAEVTETGNEKESPSTARRLETADSNASVSKRSTRGNPGADTPSEPYTRPRRGTGAPPSGVDRTDPPEAPATEGFPASGPAPVGAPSTGGFTATADRPEPAAAPEPVEAVTRAEPSGDPSGDGAAFHAGPAPEPGPESTHAARSTPQVRIGQVEVVVVNADPPARKGRRPSTSDRAALSRNYLRRF